LVGQVGRGWRWRNAGSDDAVHTVWGDAGAVRAACTNADAVLAACGGAGTVQVTCSEADVVQAACDDAGAVQAVCGAGDAVQAACNDAGAVQAACGGAGAALQRSAHERGARMAHSAQWEYYDGCEAHDWNG
jgi:hypothetical protein